MFRCYSQLQENCLEYVRKSRVFIRNMLSTLILTVANLTRLTWTCILALLIESRKEISENRSRKQLDYREKPAISDTIIYIIVDIICFVDRIFSDLYALFSLLLKLVLFAVRLKKSRRLATSVAVINLSRHLVSLSLYFFSLCPTSLLSFLFLLSTA